MTAYAELQITSNFSFLRGGSHPEELVLRAHELGLAALALTDRNTLAGVVRAHVAAKEVGIRFVVGARLDLEAARIPTPSARILPLPSARGSRVKPEGDKRTGSEKAGGLQPARSVLCFPTDRAAYGRLSRLLSQGQRRAEKGDCKLELDDLLAHAEDQIVIALAPDRLDDGFAAFLRELSHKLPSLSSRRAASLSRRRRARASSALAGLAAPARTPLVATNDVLYHGPERRPLQDVLTCIREHCTIDEAGFRLAANAERHLKPPAEMARLFRALSRRARAHARDRRALPLQPRRAALRISRRAARRGPHAAGGAGRG